MYFDFEDYRPDIQVVGRAISAREGALLSIFLHLLVFLYVLFGPSLPAPGKSDEAARHAALLAQQRREQENARFVFVQPRADLEALKPPPRAELSDKDREARTREQARTPTNRMPFSRGNTLERVEGARAENAKREPQPAPNLRDGGGGDRETPVPEPGRSALTLPSAPAAAPNPIEGREGAPRSALGQALRNLDRYVSQEMFDNPGGGGQFGPAIQFDTKGVEFGPWIRRFVAQIKRNWFIPYSAMSLRGHVVVTFYVHKDGAISALAVQAPSDVESFNNAALNALSASNPTQPLPPEYPSDKAFFTVTFFYNEAPPN
jgi:TonB family protein